MKKSIKKIMILLLLTITLTGCTKTLQDENKKAVKNEVTGQSVTENILCKPTDEEMIKIYEENEKDISSLPDCDNLKLTGDYEGLWNSFFVRPLGVAIIKLGKLFNSTALALIAITLIIRLILFPLTRNTAMQSELIKKAQPELTKLEKKYEGKTDAESMQKKSQETMLIYKKYNINPISGCLFSFIQLPLLFAFLEAINRIPAIFEGEFLTLNMGLTPWIAITNGKYIYIVIPILIIATTYFSFKMNRSVASPELEKQNKMMMIFMTVFIGFMSFTLTTAIGIYWITSSAFTIFQNLLTDRSRAHE